MSITSSFRMDDSTALAKQYAEMTAEYIENPPNVDSDPTALVPLENVFRLLEMFRYEAFADERREGVLAMNSPNQIYQMRIETKPWHESIEGALRKALDKVYTDRPKDLAIDELQGGIRNLVNNQPPDADMVSRAKEFFTTVHTQLA